MIYSNATYVRWFVYMLIAIIRSCTLRQAFCSLMPKQLRSSATPLDLYVLSFTVKRIKTANKLLYCSFKLETYSSLGVYLFLASPLDPGTVQPLPKVVLRQREEESQE